MRLYENLLSMLIIASSKLCFIINVNTGMPLKQTQYATLITLTTSLLYTRSWLMIIYNLWDASLETRTNPLLRGCPPSRTLIMMFLFLYVQFTAACNISCKKNQFCFWRYLAALHFKGIRKMRVCNLNSESFSHKLFVF